MIPGNAIPTVRLLADDTLQPVRPLRAITDILSEFRPGQRLVAEVQSQLANGSYRALIAQREVTLALPFAAKAGDSLELQVVETDGRVAFALANRPDQPATTASPPTTTTLSRTGQLIAQLTPSSEDGAPAAPPPALLNRGEPISAAAPRSGTDMTPLLQKAIGQSGVFYEAHQLAWASGKLPLETLRQEPQGRQAPLLPPLPVRPQVPSAIAAEPTTAGAAAPAAGSVPVIQAGGQTAALTALPSGTPTSPGLGDTAHPVAPAPAANPPATAADAAGSRQLPAAHALAGAAAQLPARGGESATTGNPGSPTTAGGSLTDTRPAAAPPSLPADILPVVQQQLNALATNVFQWQGIAWPGQRIDWEIVDEEARRTAAEDDVPRWQTRLRLALPSLGGIDAVIGLRGNSVDVSLAARSDDSRQTLAAAGEALRQQYAAAGLQLESLGVTHAAGDDGKDS